MSMNMMAWLEDNSGGWGEGRRYTMASSAEQERILQHIGKAALWKQQQGEKKASLVLDDSKGSHGSTILKRVAEIERLFGEENKDVGKCI